VFFGVEILLLSTFELPTARKPGSGCAIGKLSTLYQKKGDRQMAGSWLSVIRLGAEPCRN